MAQLVIDYPDDVPEVVALEAVSQMVATMTHPQPLSRYTEKMKASYSYGVGCKKMMLNIEYANRSFLVEKV